MRAHRGSVTVAVALSFGLLLLHAGGQLLGLPGLAALDLADRVGSVGGIAALTVLLEQAIRRRRWALAPLALAGQAALLVVPSLLHADAMGATYDPRALLAGLALQALLTLAVVATALRLEDAVEALLSTTTVVPRPPGRLLTTHPATAQVTWRARRPPVRAPPRALPA